MHLEQDGIHYYNSGGWIDSRLTYITVGEDGVQIHEYQEREDVGGEAGSEMHLASGEEEDSAVFEDYDYEEAGSRL